MFLERTPPPAKQKRTLPNASQQSAIPVALPTASASLPSSNSSTFPSATLTPAATSMATVEVAPPMQQQTQDEFQWAPLGSAELVHSARKPSHDQQKPIAHKLPTASLPILSDAAKRATVTTQNIRPQTQQTPPEQWQHLGPLPPAKQPSQSHSASSAASSRALSTAEYDERPLLGAAMLTQTQHSVLEFAPSLAATSIPPGTAGSSSLGSSVTTSQHARPRAPSASAPVAPEAGGSGFPPRIPSLGSIAQFHQERDELSDWHKRSAQQFHASATLPTSPAKPVLSAGLGAEGETSMIIHDDQEDEEEGKEVRTRLAASTSAIRSNPPSSPFHIPSNLKHTHSNMTTPQPVVGDAITQAGCAPTPHRLEPSERISRISAHELASARKSAKENGAALEKLQVRCGKLETMMRELREDRDGWQSDAEGLEAKVVALREELKAKEYTIAKLEAEKCKLALEVTQAEWEAVTVGKERERKLQIELVYAKNEETWQRGRAGEEKSAREERETLYAEDTDRLRRQREEARSEVKQLKAEINKLGTASKEMEREVKQWKDVAMRSEATSAQDVSLSFSLSVDSVSLTRKMRTQSRTHRQPKTTVSRSAAASSEGPVFIESSSSPRAPTRVKAIAASAAKSSSSRSAFGIVAVKSTESTAATAAMKGGVKRKALPPMFGASDPSSMRPSSDAGFDAEEEMGRAERAGTPSPKPKPRAQVHAAVVAAAAKKRSIYREDDDEETEEEDDDDQDDWRGAPAGGKTSASQRSARTRTASGSTSAAAAAPKAKASALSRAKAKMTDDVEKTPILPSKAKRFALAEVKSSKRNAASADEHEDDLAVKKWKPDAPVSIFAVAKTTAATARAAPEVEEGGAKKKKRRLLNGGAANLGQLAMAGGEVSVHHGSSLVARIELTLWFLTVRLAQSNLSAAIRTISRQADCRQGWSRTWHVPMSSIKDYISPLYF